MCTTCGCGDGNARVEIGPVTASGLRPVSAQPATLVPGAAPGGIRLHAPEGAAPLGAVHAPGMSHRRIVEVERDLLAANDLIAARNRQRLAARGIFALNLVSSPGSGKTTLLVRTIELLQDVAVGVVEGDQQTSRDADRIRATGVPAIQVNTGKGCHLDARMVEEALAALPLPQGSLLMIENVGNLVCPAAFDLGEAHKVVILSVTEGDDKPLKYPDMFRAADLMLIAKIDLLPHVDFSVDAAFRHAHSVRPGLPALCLSARTGEGMPAWLAWLRAGMQRSRAAAHARAPSVSRDALAVGDGHGSR